MKKMVYLVGWEYWNNNKGEYVKVEKMYDTREERDATFENLCPCIHEYPWKKDCEMTEQEIEEIRNPKPQMINEMPF